MHSEIQPYFWMRITGVETDSVKGCFYRCETPLWALPFEWDQWSDRWSFIASPVKLVSHSLLEPQQFKPGEVVAGKRMLAPMTVVRQEGNLVRCAYHDKEGVPHWLEDRSETFIKVYDHRSYWDAVT